MSAQRLHAVFGVDKVCSTPGWPAKTPTDRTLRGMLRKPQFIVDKGGPAKRWNRKTERYEQGWWMPPRSVALRLDGIGVLDFDTDHPDIENVARPVLEAVPALYDAPVRLGSGLKEAWFFRVGEDADDIYRLPNRRWIAPGDDPDDPGVDTHQVEIFGGGGEYRWREDGTYRQPKRYFGAFGAHTVETATGKVLKSYRWVEDYSPLTAPRAELPLLSKADLFKAQDVSEAAFKDLGWREAPGGAGGGSLSGQMVRVYDLTHDMDIDGHTLARLYEMAESGEIGGGIRTPISPVPWLRKSSRSGASCCLTVASNGAPAIVDWQENTLHLPASLQPGDASALAEKLQKLIGARQIDVVDLLAGTLVELVTEVARKRVGRDDNR